MKVLITGATGNIRLALLEALEKRQSNLSVFAGLRNIEKDKSKLENFSVTPIYFDFENESTFKDALGKMDILFLLGPPQIADVPKYFKPLINEAVN